MARQLRQLILGALSCVATATATAQEPQPSARQPQDSASPRQPGQRPLAAEFGNVRRALEALTPEQRQRFIENLKRWSNLPPEEKKVLADRDGLRRKKIADEIDLALKNTGLMLEGERRAQFARRYAEERRKVEEQLRRELDEKRQPLVNEILARLKAEFSAGNTAPK